MLPFLRRKLPVEDRLSADLDRIIQAIRPDRAPSENRTESLMTSLAALNALMCKGAEGRYDPISYDDLKEIVASYLDRDAFGVVVERLSELPITLALVAAAAQDCRHDGPPSAALSAIRRKAEDIITRLNRCVMA